MESCTQFLIWPLSLATAMICAILLMLVTARFLLTKMDYLQTFNIRWEYNDRRYHSCQLAPDWNQPGGEKEDIMSSIFIRAGSHIVYFAMSHMQVRKVICCSITYLNHPYGHSPFRHINLIMHPLIGGVLQVTWHSRAISCEPLLRE